MISLKLAAVLILPQSTRSSRMWSRWEEDKDGCKDRKTQQVAQGLLMSNVMHDASSRISERS